MVVNDWYFLKEREREEAEENNLKIIINLLIYKMDLIMSRSIGFYEV